MDNEAAKGAELKGVAHGALMVRMATKRTCRSLEATWPEREAFGGVDASGEGAGVIVIGLVLVVPVVGVVVAIMRGRRS